MLSLLSSFGRGDDARDGWRWWRGGRSHGFAFVAAEIIHDDNVVRPEGGNENLLDNATAERYWR
jgi:hypothetical protein